MNIPSIRAVATQQSIRLTWQIVVVIYQRDTDRQAGRQTDRRADRQADRQTDGQTVRQTVKDSGFFLSSGRVPLTFVKSQRSKRALSWCYCSSDSCQNSTLKVAYITSKGQ